MGCARDRRPLKIFGAGTAVRDYIYIDDAIEVMLRAATRAGPIVATCPADEEPACGMWFGN
jgi:UDP-glucose 4-epimerase